MVRIQINGQEVKIEENKRLWEIMKERGIKVPHFCYHEGLSIGGNCRACVVETKMEMNGIEMSKMIPSCTVEITRMNEGHKYETESEGAIDAREAVMELLLKNHPLDCPICDEGGECTLQDQALKYGRVWGISDEVKRRGVEDQNWGPLIKTVMTRCILCTRCVRYDRDIIGENKIITYGRGVKTKIKLIGDRIESEISGNVVDLCPIGMINQRLSINLH